MSNVILNKIDIENSHFDYDKINKLYDFYLIENHAESFKKNARIFDDTLLKENVLAVQYTSGKSFILMLKKDRMNETAISEIIKNAQSEDYDLTKKKLPVPFESYPHSFLQILFNALAKSEKQDVSNLGGKLYYFSEMPKSEKQLFCVEFKISTGYKIDLLGRTFTKSEKSFGEPEYVLQANNTLKLRSKDDKSKSFYTLGQYKGTRHETTFLNASNTTQFEKSKIGIFSKLLEKFHARYGDFIQLEIKEEADWEKLEVKSSILQKREHLRKIKRGLEHKTLNIVDTIGDSSSKKFCELLKKSFENLFTDEKYFLGDNRELNFNICISNSVKPDCLNLRVIHSKSYYENQADEKDPYAVYSDMVVQHVTLEDFTKTRDGSLSEAACIVLVNELLVKSDLIQRNNQISLADWNSYNFEQAWTFCHCEEEFIDNGSQKKTKINHFYMMSIQPNGNFEIKEVTKDSSENNMFSLFEEIFEMNNMSAERHNKFDEKYRGLVINPKSEINIIQDSSYFTMPNFLEIKDALKNGTINRTKNALEKFFGASIDIYYKKSIEDNCEYYSVGQIGSGMNTTIERAARMRKVLPYDNSQLFFRQVLDTMNVIFVRNGQLTVLPFPFKYLREYAKMNGSIEK